MLSISSTKEKLSLAPLIEGGYGEFLIYKDESSETKPSPIDQKTYQLCYQVLIKSRQIIEESEKQKFLEFNLKVIDPAIKIAFIPRTLYELCFIKKCLKETLRLESICKNSKFARINRAESNCWHGAYFRDFGDDQDEIIIDLAYRLNNSILRNFKTNGPFSYDQITSLANRKLAFLNLCHEDSNSDVYRKLSEVITASDSCEISVNMIDEYHGAFCKPLGIKTKKMKEIVLNAIALECSDEAKGKLIIYRGSNVVDDKPLEYNEENKVNFVQSLSYGTGLFAGGMFDPGATAFYYIRKEEKDAIAILIPKEEEASSPFAIPTTHPLCQMFGRGEKFHARSRAPTIGVDSEVTIECKGGPSLGKVGNVSSHFLLAVDPQQFDDKFQYYMKKHVVNLKD